MSHFNLQGDDLQAYYSKIYWIFLCSYSIHYKAFYSSWDLCSEENNDWNNRITLVIYLLLIYTPKLFNKICEYQKYM